ncbi:MAG TPA: TIGR03084 family metal-binding protein [Acidimicrobiales bacterium]|nr:TIGR03084 family metal-binding protein [Acidimicrobiales bacterium]
MTSLEGLLADLAAEQDELDAVLGALAPEDFELPTPAEGWAVRDQVSHLAYFDASAVLALAAPERFAEHRRSLMTGAEGREPDLALGRSVPPDALLRAWRSGREHLAAAASSAEPSRRVPWYGPEMSLASFVTARLMETWAHGQDVRDALGLRPSETDRLRHICHLGVAARAYAHAVHGAEDDGRPVRVELLSPGGTVWSFGPEDAPDRITGSGLGFALVVTQRRHPDDTDVTAVGSAATRWLSVAQAFAGPAGAGRPPGLGVVAPGR